MSIERDEEVRRWTARRNAALVMETIQRLTTVAEATPQHDLRSPRWSLGRTMPSEVWKTRSRPGQRKFVSSTNGN